ncbi:MAG: hypothetical protein SNJ82_12475, partial [Gemmataceae bacterium]
MCAPVEQVVRLSRSRRYREPQGQDKPKGSNHDATVADGGVHGGKVSFRCPALPCWEKQAFACFSSALGTVGWSPGVAHLSVQANIAR